MELKAGDTVTILRAEKITLIEFVEMPGNNVWITDKGTLRESELKKVIVKPDAKISRY